jgi:hypothetical protein
MHIRRAAREYRLEIVARKRNRKNARQISIGPVIDKRKNSEENFLNIKSYKPISLNINKCASLKKTLKKSYHTVRKFRVEILILS